MKWRFVVSLAGAILLSLAEATGAFATNSQVGAQTSQGDQTNGVLTVISAPAAQTDSNYRFYWADVLLNTNEWYQAGYVDPPGQPGCITWFFQTWYGGSLTHNTAGTCGWAGAHTFAIGQEGWNGSSYNWVLPVDGAYTDSVTSAASWGLTNTLQQ